MWSRQNEFSSDWTWSREQKSSLSQCTLLHFGGLKVDWRQVNGPWEKFALLQLGQKLNHHKVLGNLISPEPENYSQKKKLNKSVEYIPNPHQIYYYWFCKRQGMHSLQAPVELWRQWWVMRGKFSMDTSFYDACEPPKRSNHWSSVFMVGWFYLQSLYSYMPNLFTFIPHLTSICSKELLWNLLFNFFKVFLTINVSNLCWNCRYD